jgi:hypothetical protein
MIWAGGFGKVAHVVEHHGHRQLLQNLLQLDDLVAFGHKLDVPAMLRNLTRNRCHVVHGGTARQARAKPHASNAGSMQAIHFGARDGSVEHGHPVCIPAERLDGGVHEKRVVSSIGRGLHDDVAG